MVRAQVVDDENKNASGCSALVLHIVRARIGRDVLGDTAAYRS
jgi:hypothetical protein